MLGRMVDAYRGQDRVLPSTPEEPDRNAASAGHQRSTDEHHPARRWCRRADPARALLTTQPAGRL